MSARPLSEFIPDLILYTRDGCHLCDDARDAIETVLAERLTGGRPTPTFREVDIAGDPDLDRTYRDRIPVVQLGDERLDLIIGPSRLVRMLERVLDGVTASP